MFFYFDCSLTCLDFEASRVLKAATCTAGTTAVLRICRGNASWWWESGTQELIWRWTSVELLRRYRTLSFLPLAFFDQIPMFTACCPDPKVYLSTRSGAWVVGRVGAGGLPFDLDFSRVQFLIGQLFPSWFNRTLETKLNAALDHKLYGLRPNHG